MREKVGSVVSKPALSMTLSEGGEAHGADKFLGLPTLFWQALNLILFLAVLVHFLRKPVVAFFSGRREEVDRDLKKAREDRARAEALATELAAKVVRIEAEVAEIREQARRHAAEDQEALLKQATVEAAKVVARAEAEIESRIRTARVQLTALAGDLAVDLAREILARNLNGEDQERLLREGLAGIERASSARGAASPA